MTKKIKITEEDLKNIILKVINEDYYEEEEVQDWDTDNIIDTAISGDRRRFRVAIYYEGIVPETDDVEHDRKVAEWLVDQERDKLTNASNTWTDKIEFVREPRNLIDPFY